VKIDKPPDGLKWKIALLYVQSDMQFFCRLLLRQKRIHFTRRATLGAAALWVSLLMPGAYGQMREQDFLPDAPKPTIELISAADPGQSFPPAAPGPPQSTLHPFPSGKPACVDMQSRTSTGPQISCGPTYDPFQKFINNAEPRPMTPREKAILAGRDVIDPFNLLTIGGLSAISVASDSHSAYGPGIKGWAKLSGVSLTQDMTNEFFGTFLIPSIMHQDPHFHRFPNASYKRRIAHCIYQVVWTQGDDGKGMFNYANVVGGIFEEAISDAYVPYRDTSWGAASARYGTALVTDPIGNFITEFVPDLARHVNFHVVFVQRIINRVAIEETQ
jgi:hypothetical protein